MRMLFIRHTLGPNKVESKRNSDLAPFGGDFRNMLKISSKGQYHRILWNVLLDFGKIRSAVRPCASRELCEVLIPHG